MKRTVFFIIFLVLITVLFASCATAITNVSSIVGTWIQEGGTVWVFYSNGTGIAGKENFTYGISAEGEIYLSNGWGARKLFMSPDGKRMIIMGIVFKKK